MSKEIIQTSRIEQALIQNNLANLNDQERLNYYKQVCESLGLNPATQPFGYIQLNGKLCLYAKKDATDQLRKIHSVSVIITSRIREDGIYSVTARAKTMDGREDESLGAVNIASLKGDALANALMKAETKAKRRVTLSICGLGMLDELEAETTPNAQIELRKENPAQVETIKKEQQSFNCDKQPAPVTKDEVKPIINHAPREKIKATIENYRLEFNFGQWKKGISFAELGVHEVKRLQAQIMTYALKQESENKVIPESIKDFIELSKQYVASIELK